MTTRPLDPESRRRPLCAAVALVLVMMAVLLAAGCVGWLGGKYNHDQNVLITKMNPEGLVVWTKLIDTGKYDYGLDFIETSDGGFIVVGGTSKIVCGNFNPPSPEKPHLTRLSSSGDILWEQDYDMRINAVVQNRDDSFSAVSDRGVILDLDPNGIVVNKRTPGIHQEGNNEWESINTFIRLKDDGFLLAGQTIGKTDPLGNLSWQQSDNQSINTAFSIAEMKNQQGYLVVVYHNSLGQVILHLDQNGSIVRKVPMGSFDQSLKPIIQQTDEGYTVLSTNYACSEHSSYCNGNYVAVHLDNEGKKIDLVNLTDTTYLVIFPMQNGSFVSYRIVSSGNSVKETRLNPDGTVIWEKTNKCSEIGCPPNELGGPTIMTADGGFALMMPIEKQYAC